MNPSEDRSNANSVLFGQLVSYFILTWLGICLILFFLQVETRDLLYTVPSFFRALNKLVFDSLFRFPEGFWSAIVFEGISLILHGAIGVLFLRLFVRLPRVLEGIAGIFMGIGLATFVLELLAIFFLLNIWTAWLTLLVLIAGLCALHRMWGTSDACFQTDVDQDESLTSRVLYWGAFVCLTVITVLSFYHAVFFPVDYWDALIYYVEYAERTYKNGGFPILVCLQVGLGLGANYPHLYPLHQAVTATLFGSWSDLYGQFICPFAALGAVIVVYYLVLAMWKNRLIAMLSALSFRTLPYVTSYTIWASDYSLVMVFTGLFMLFVYWFLHNSSCKSLQPLLCCCAIAPHINYLGWIVWPCLALAIWMRRTELFNESGGWRCVIGSFAFWFGLALIWSVRNWIVTGNPVYAFFPSIFGGKNIDPDVLRSCNNEWRAHGDFSYLGRNLWERLLNSPGFFIANWRVAPLAGGILFPSFLLGWKRERPFFVVMGVLVFLYLFYQYVLSGLYLYHIIAVFPILAVFMGRFLQETGSRRIVHWFGVMILIAGFSPGITYSIMGSKMKSPDLPFFHHPGLAPEDFYHYTFPRDAPVWRFINEKVEPGAKILTHDNRYHVYRDDLQIIHLDDCGILYLYGKPYPKVHQELLARGIQYYLYIPDEETHPITQSLGHRFYLSNPDYFELLMSYQLPYQTERVRFYRLLKGPGS